MSVALGDISVKIQLHEISKTFLPMFSSKTLTLSQHIFKSFITLNFFFCEWCKLVLKLHLFCMQLSSSSNSIYWRGYFYSIFCCCPLCQILIHLRESALFLGSLFCSIGPCVFPYASTRLFWLQWPCNTVWYQVLWSLLLCSSFSKLLQLFMVIYSSI